MEESPFPGKGGYASCLCKEGCYGFWEVPWGLCLVLGFPLDILLTFLRLFQAWLGMLGYRCKGVEKVGKARLGWEGNKYCTN